MYFFMLELFSNDAILFILIKMSAFLFLSMAVQKNTALGFISESFLSCIIKCALFLRECKWSLQEHNLIFKWVF